VFRDAVGTLGKIARDVSLQMQTEVGELGEPAAAGKAARRRCRTSATRSAARRCSPPRRAPNLVATVFAAMVQEHERALGGWQAEWDALPDLARLTGGALAQIAQIAAVSTSHRAPRRESRRHARADPRRSRDARARRPIGRLDAHVVEHASKQAVRTGATLFDVLAADPAVSAHLSRDALAQLLDPAHYVGEAHACVDAVLALHAGAQ
jgi:3-carboxy-cis,cis-muconate cycloisomerase